MTPAVTVLLPVYNAEDTISSAVQSILDQTFADFELLIINDGSTDKTLQYISEFDDIRIRTVSFDSNRGISRALNYGIKLAQSELIARMDADDFSLPERLEKQFIHLKLHPDCGLVSSLVQHKSTDHHQEGYKHYVNQINTLITAHSMVNHRFQDSPIAHPSVMFRKQLVERYGGYNEQSIPEDYELWLRFMYNDVIFNKIDHNLLIWNDLTDRISRINEAYSDSKFFQLKAKYLALHFKKQSGELPDLYVWGTGRLVNRNSQYLISEGFNILKYIDIKPNDEVEKYLYFKDLPTPDMVIVVSYVRDRKGKLEIANYLNEKGYRLGMNYFLMS